MTTINTNIQSINAQRSLATSRNDLSTSMARLSSGLRVNSSKDDAAGLAIAERMNAQVRGMNVAIRNSNDGISLAQTAESAMGRLGESLQRMRELAVQSANETNSISDRSALNAEFQQLALENARVITNTQFNGQRLLTASGGAAGTGLFSFQVGANASSDNQITIALTTHFSAGMSNSTVGATANLGTTAASALVAMGEIDAALNFVSSQRATMGASQNRFDGVVSNLRVAAENVATARGRIIDADFGMETANLSRAQILQQAGTAMLSQANQLPQGALALLR